MPVLLGMTDYPAVRSLVDRGELTLDYLEVHGPYVQSARLQYPHTPMLLHNALYQWSLAHADGVDHKNCAQITQERLEQTRSPWYSLHLGFSAEEVDFQENSMRGLSPVLAPEIIFERTCRTLKVLKDRLSVPLLVENLDYNPGGAYETICQPEFISRVLENTGALLLLDLAHARISAAALDMPIQTYLDALPLEKVRQLHVNRPLLSGQRLWDAHEALQVEDFELLEWVLSRTQPWAVTLEYNKEEALINAQIGQLRRILQNGP